MKKVLFASTALVMSAGFAAADVSISGEAGFGLSYDGTDTTLGNYLEYFLSSTVETDSGITLTASSDLSTAGMHDVEVGMSFNGLKVNTGGVSNAADGAGIADVGYGGLGVDNVAEGSVAYGGHDVHVGYSFGDISVAVSMDSADDEIGLGISGTLAGVSFFLGLDDDNGTNATAVGVGYSEGAVSLKASYEEQGAANSSGVSVAYTTGDVTITAAYATSTAAANDAYGIGFSYDLGGASLDGGFAEVGGNTVADLGVNFTF